MAGRYDSRIAEVAGLVTVIHNDNVIINGSSVACLVGELETEPELTGAGVRVIANLETDIIGTNLGTHTFAVGSLGTYDGTELRVESPKTSQMRGNVYRIRWTKS